jgi:hypothetical protein
MAEQKREELATKKDAFSVLMMFLTAHQRALTVPLRKFYGAEALGFPGVYAAVLMVGWAAVSRDPLMWAWLAVWLACLVARRIETMKLVRQGKPPHTMYDGVPYSVLRGWDEKVARMVIEPVVMFVMGLGLRFIAVDFRLPVKGLSLFLMLGIFTLPTLEIIRGTVMKKRVQAMGDARIEQEVLIEGLKVYQGEGR